MELEEQWEEKKNANNWRQKIVYKKLVLDKYHLNIPHSLTSSV